MFSILAYNWQSSEGGFDELLNIGYTKEKERSKKKCG